MKPDMTDVELEEALTHFTDYMEKNADVGRFDMCAVVHGHLIGKRLEGQPTDVASLKWYQAALSNKSGVAYTNLYQYGKNNERLLTMAVRFSDNNVLAMNLYPERLNGLLSDNKLPKDSYYYLCDPSGNIMFTINDRNLSIEEEQPYVDKIFKKIRDSDSDVSYITDYEGNKRGGYYTVSEKGWISIVTIPYDFLMGDYKDLMQWFSLTLAIFLLLAAGLALREHMLNKQLQSINEVIRVMSKSFLAVFRVNYVTGRYYMLKSTSPGPQEPEGDYDELLQELIKNVEPEATEEFATSFAREHIKELVERYINDFGGEFRYRFGKEYRWLNVRLMRDDVLNKDEAVFFFREVDAEKQKELEHIQVTEQALQVARENAKSRNMFFSALSHDMRAPLNGIIGMAELAELHKDDCVQVKEYIRKISAAGQQLLTLINDILEMARPGQRQGGACAGNLYDCQGSAGYQRYFCGCQAELEQKFFDSQLMLQEDEMVSGDLQGLQQILNNILSNAIKYTKAHGKISFLARRELSNERNRVHYTFVIKDTGCGMSAKFLEKIYKPFERDSRFGVPRVTGTGLGMMIVKSLVERMDGSIHISSRVDEGTCVIISLPFNIVKKVESKPQDAMPKLENFAGCKILVAEDNSINMEIISELLTMNGLEVLPASNGKEAVKLFESSQEGSINMVLMDMQMPEMDGCEAAEAIRALPREDALKVPILALTGNSGSDDVERAMAAGMNDFMVKPVQMKLLAQMMSAYLQH